MDKYSVKFTLTQKLMREFILNARPRQALIFDVGFPLLIGAMILTEVIFAKNMFDTRILTAGLILAVASPVMRVIKAGRSSKKLFCAISEKEGGRADRENTFGSDGFTLSAPLRGLSAEYEWYRAAAFYKTKNLYIIMLGQREGIYFPRTEISDPAAFEGDIKMWMKEAKAKEAALEKGEKKKKR